MNEEIQNEQVEQVEQVEENAKPKRTRRKQNEQVENIEETADRVNDVAEDAAKDVENVAEVAQDATSEEVEGFRVRVKVTALNIREEPTTASKVLSVPVSGDILKVTDDQGDWLELVGSGYVMAKYVEMVD